MRQSLAARDGVLLVRTRLAVGRERLVWVHAVTVSAWGRQHKASYLELHQHTKSSTRTCRGLKFSMAFLNTRTCTMIASSRCLPFMTGGPFLQGAVGQGANHQTA